MLNHVSSASALSAFMDDARAAGLTIPVLAAVAVFTDVVSAAVLQGLPGLELESALVDEVVNAPIRSRPASQQPLPKRASC